MASPGAKSCVERDRLVEAYTEAKFRYDSLHSQRIFAVIQGVDSPTVGELAKAEMAKENAQAALLAHAKEHGC